MFMSSFNVLVKMTVYFDLLEVLMKFHLAIFDIKLKENKHKCKYAEDSLQVFVSFCVQYYRAVKMDTAL